MGEGWREVEDVNLPGFFSKRTGDEDEKCSHLAFCLPLFLREGVWGMIDTQYYGSMNKRRFPEDLFGAIAIARHAFQVVKHFLWRNVACASRPSA